MDVTHIRCDRRGRWVCLASWEHKAELLFIRLQKKWVCIVLLLPPVCLQLSLSLSLHPSLCQDGMEYISRSMCGSFPPLHTFSSPLPPGLTHKPVFFRKRTHALSFSHTMSRSLSTNSGTSCRWHPRQGAKLT